MKYILALLLLFFVGCSKQETPWCVTIPTKDQFGNPVTIKIFPEPLDHGGYVVNIIRPEDVKRNDGSCWGYTLRPDKDFPDD